MGARLASRLETTNQTWIWAGLCLLLALGATTSLLDLFKLPAAESRRANAAQQRVIIDAVTGIVSGLKAADATDEPAFDVEEKTPKPEEKSDLAKTPDPKTAESTPTKMPEPAADTLPADLPKLRTEAPAANTEPVPMNKWSLTTAPAPEVSEKQPDGTLLPKRGDKGTTPFSLYAQPFTRSENQSRLAIVLLDAGMNEATTDLLLTLPRQITVAVSPYMQHGRDTMTRLRNTGFETWAMLPTMSEHYPLDDPGPLGLIVNLPSDEQLKRLHKAMTATLGAAGYILSPDDGLAISKENMATALNELDARGFALLSTHPAHSIAPLTDDAKRRSMMHRADMILDDVANDAVIRSKLAGLSSFAQSRTDTVVVAYARPQTIEILADWLKKEPLPEPVVLAPLSAVYVKEAPPPPVRAEGESTHGKATEPAKSGHH